MQVLVLLLGRLTPPRGAASHVIDEFVMPRIQAMLFALAEQRHVLPARFAVGAVKIARSVMLTLCRPHTGGIALVVESPRLGLVEGVAVRLFDRLLDPIGKLVNFVGTGGLSKSGRRHGSR